VATRALGLDTLAPELVAVTVANLAAAALRFSILRTWVFRPRFGTHLEPVTLTGTAEGVPTNSRGTAPATQRMSR